MDKHVGGGGGGCSFSHSSSNPKSSALPAYILELPGLWIPGARDGWALNPDLLACLQVVAAALHWVYTDEVDANLDGEVLLQVGS